MRDEDPAQTGVLHPIAPAHPAAAVPCCPTCGQVPVSQRTTVEHGVVTGNYLCGNDHAYVMRWLDGGVA